MSGSDDFLRDHIEGALAQANFAGKRPADAVMEALRALGLDAVPDDIPGATNDFEPTDCEWPVRSGWRHATCGRSGARAARHWGIRLCWQHEDAVISEALARVRDGKAHDDVLDALVESVRDDLLRPQHAGWTDAIDDEIVRRLREGWNLSPHVREAFDEYIASAVRERWSA